MIILKFLRKIEHFNCIIMAHTWNSFYHYGPFILTHCTNSDNNITHNRHFWNLYHLKVWNFERVKQWVTFCENLISWKYHYPATLFVMSFILNLLIIKVETSSIPQHTTSSCHSRKKNTGIPCHIIMWGRLCMEAWKWKKVMTY